MSTTTTQRSQPKRAERSASSRPIAGPDDWYKDAIIYELHVRAFQDSNNDGVGDFKGLTSRLDYLQDLGVTAIWLLPFYPSPLRDDGYDIAGYTSVHESYGSMADFRRFVKEAHKRDLRVITELVINHTSDQHPWFQRARKAPAGSKQRDWYVWSDSPDKYPGVRIIFQDTETSNWSWDPVAQQYYWHRFFSHQPDLNFDNPEVMRAVKKVMDFWFETGVDGMRLDAVPYLVEREGTNCENLPETHDKIRELRTHLDERWPGRMLLAEANQWPEDAIAYFGEDGDECHMNFHFPLMPRLFMSLRMEDRFPIVDILQQTPEIPEGSQWAMFLRNHDELTLEMVTDEERDYMYRSYASDRQMRINVGIRRRLSPLLEHDRRKIELMNGLLMSMPGTPVLYYGDEIGMGDNVYLGDRDAVRTPMQWSADRNGGFSRTSPQKLFLPANIEPGSHYENINVENQQQTPSSLLWWMKRLIALRRRHPVLGRGEMEFLHPENAKVLAFLRTNEDEQMLVIANLSRFAQPVELDLSRFEGRRLIEVFGHTRFPRIGELPYFLTLGPHTFHWFVIEPEEDGAQDGDHEPPAIEITGEASRWLRGAGLKRWASRSLAEQLPRKRWFASKARTIREVAVDDVLPLGELDEGVLDAVLALVRVGYTDGDDDLYTLPLALVDPDRAVTQQGVQDVTILGSVRRKSDGVRYTLVDASGDEAFWGAAHHIVLKKRTIKGDRGTLTGLREISAKAARSDGNEFRVPRVEQSNSSALLDASAIFKLFRRVEPGVNPDYEIGVHLSREARFANTPTMEGAIQYKRSGEEPYTIATRQQLVQNEGDAWAHALGAVGRYFERALASSEDSATPRLPAERPILHAASDPTDEEHQLFDGYIDIVELLGRRTGEMHRAMADSRNDDFAPEPFTKLYLRSLYQTLRSGVRRPLQGLRAKASSLEGEARELADRLLERRDDLVERIGLVRSIPLEGVRIRCHGDYHLGQVLWTGMDFFIIDFEGEPMRPLGERRLKRSCLVDVAGMCRSLDYAPNAGLRDLEERGMLAASDVEDEDVRAYADYWSFCAQAAFLRGYLRVIEPPLVPSYAGALAALLDAWTLHKAIYEINYELNNRPDWITIPLRGVLGILDSPTPA